MSHNNPTNYGPTYSDAGGRPMTVVQADCGCCGRHVNMNLWSLSGHGTARCTDCRRWRCNIIRLKPRCGAILKPKGERKFGRPIAARDPDERP